MGRSGSLNTSVEQTEYWLRERDATAFQYFEKESLFNHFAMPATLGVNPSGHPKLPAEYLPAPTALYIAARLGCRLPTSDEWKAAYTRTPRDAPWNLRDQTWERQRQHVAGSGGRLEWPDAGTFWPKDYKGPRRTGADAESQRTGATNNLWFREVDDGGGAARAAWCSRTSLATSPSSSGTMPAGSSRCETSPSRPSSSCSNSNRAGCS